MPSDLTLPFSDENPCKKCRRGVCHRCLAETDDALPAPHMGVVLCSACFYEKFTR
jgi:hypothetical protein